MRPVHAVVHGVLVGQLTLEGFDRLDLAARLAAGLRGVELFGNESRHRRQCLPVGCGRKANAAAPSASIAAMAANTAP